MGLRMGPTMGRMEGPYPPLRTTVFSRPRRSATLALVQLIPASLVPSYCCNSCSKFGGRGVALGACACCSRTLARWRVRAQGSSPFQAADITRNCNASARVSCGACAPRRAPPSGAAGTRAESAQQHYPGARDFATNCFATWRLNAATFSCWLALQRCPAGGTPSWKLAAVHRGTPQYSPRCCLRLRRRQLAERRSR